MIVCFLLIVKYVDWTFHEVQMFNKECQAAQTEINANNQVEVEFTLKPNQTFILGLNKVVDGRAVDSINRKK
jgi:hypothetical protein